MGRGVVVGVAPFVWIVHLGALIFFVRRKTVESFYEVFFRCGVSAVLVILLYGGVLSAAKLIDRHAVQAHAELALVASMLLAILVGTAVAFWRFGLRS